MTSLSSVGLFFSDRDLATQAKEALIEIAAGMVRTGHPAASDPEKLYRKALERFMGSLLARFEANKEVRPAHRTAGINQGLAKKISALSPMGIGELYEYLRGFRLELNSRRDPELVPSQRGKRNQGLFYTPPRVVGYIVKRALDALEVADSLQYAAIRVLDPAVGAGLFLVEALEQIVSRLIEGKGSKFHQAMSQIMERMRGRAAAAGSRIKLDLQTGLRLHILENCLYGIDLDPLAVAIARSVLLYAAFSGHIPIRDARLNLRVGNALVGTGRGAFPSFSRDAENEKHYRLFFGGKPADRIQVTKWAQSKGLFHWTLEFPEVFSGPSDGFDVVVGNPPYEVVSVRESGIEQRSLEQAYFRRTHRTCQGKINTYRLMLERGLDLLQDKGSLGFIIPATLLADSTAEKLRRKILDDSNVLAVVATPEKARVFSGVTQACLILVTRKGQPTRLIHPVMWNGRGPIPSRAGVEITRELIEKCGSRIPLVQSREEKELLEALMRHPMLRGDGSVPAVGHVHQGEINLTVHRRFITDKCTANVCPLIRGEHVKPFQVVHPTPRAARLDWVLPDFFTSSRDRSQPTLWSINSPAQDSTGGRVRGAPWETERIVLGRVVNMGTDRRLKAAAAPRGVLLGDMTNSITDIAVPFNYLLGVLNSSLLNWRIRVTSTNNYISADEIESLPVPRVSGSEVAPEKVQRAWKELAPINWKSQSSIEEWIEKIGSAFGSCSDKQREALAATMIERVVGMIRADIGIERRGTEPAMQSLLDALVLLLYGVDSCPRFFEKGMRGHARGEAW